MTEAAPGLAPRPYELTAEEQRRWFADDAEPAPAGVHTSARRKPSLARLFKQEPMPPALPVLNATRHFSLDSDLRRENLSRAATWGRAWIGRPATPHKTERRK